MDAKNILPATPVEEETKHTTQPIVTGTSVVGIKLRTCGKNTIVGAGGEYSDFQYISEMLDDLRRDERSHDDGCVMGPSEVHSYLTRVLHNRRNKGDPLWNTMVVGGVDHAGKSFLGQVDHIGTAFADDFVTTGFGHHFAMPILREEWRADLTEAEARTLVEKVMRVCYYRDCRTINKIQIAKVTADSAVVSEPYSLDTKWDYKAFVKAKAGMDTGGSW